MKEPPLVFVIRGNRDAVVALEIQQKKQRYPTKTRQREKKSLNAAATRLRGV